MPRKPSAKAPRTSDKKQTKIPGTPPHPGETDHHPEIEECIRRLLKYTATMKAAKDDVKNAEAKLAEVMRANNLRRYANDGWQAHFKTGKEAVVPGTYEPFGTEGATG